MNGAIRIVRDSPGRRLFSDAWRGKLAITGQAPQGVCAINANERLSSALATDPGPWVRSAIRHARAQVSRSASSTTDQQEQQQDLRQEDDNRAHASHTPSPKATAAPTRASFSWRQATEREQKTEMCECYAAHSGVPR